MKSYGVTIQMKPPKQYFQMVLFIQYEALTFESVDEILWCYHSNEISFGVLSHSTFGLKYSILETLLKFDFGYFWEWEG